MILLTGARGVVGHRLRVVLGESGRIVRPVSRSATDVVTLTWDLETSPSPATLAQIRDCNCLIHCAPLWLLTPHLSTLVEAGVTRIIAFSSTSVVSKQTSTHPDDQSLVKKLSNAESALMARSDAQITLFRPSMIYGYAKDQNVSHIALRLKRLRIMPLAGAATGLRQPVHADDICRAALAALEKQDSVGKIYNLAGGDHLSYRAMVERIFQGLGMRPRFLVLPLFVFRFLLKLGAWFGGFDYTSSMANRMNQDLVYDVSLAVRDLQFDPQPFLSHPKRDLPQ